MSAPHFVDHDKTDSVGVVVVETVKPQTEMTGWVMETVETIKIKALDAIPIGHKVALGDIGKVDEEGYLQLVGRRTFLSSGNTGNPPGSKGAVSFRPHYHVVR